MRFDGKIALVTGGASGIGEEVALRLASEGAAVAVADLNLGAAEATLAKITEAGGRGIALAVDVSNPEQVAKMVADTVAELGGLHLAVNNAGIPGHNAKIEDLPVAAWDRVININLSGVAYCLREEMPAIIASGGGAVVNMASIAGAVAVPQDPAYTAAKHGVVGLTKAVGSDYGTTGVRVNAVGPGFIATPLLNSLPNEVTDEIAQAHPVKRLGEAAEVAALVAFLLSDEASFITGSYHLVDGGYTAV